MTTTERDIAQFLKRCTAPGALETERAELPPERRSLCASKHWTDLGKKYAAKIRELEQRAAELSAQFERRPRRPSKI